MTHNSDILWLASYPKSGNTWLRFILTNLLYQEISKSQEVDHYIPDIHTPAGVQRLQEPNQEIIISKTHFMLSDCMPFKARTLGFIYIHRHPFDVMISNLRYLLNWANQNLDQAQKSTIIHQYIDDFIENRGDFRWLPFGFGSWTKHVEFWLKNPYHLPGCILRYEDMVSHPIQELQRLCHFLGIEATVPNLQDAIERSSKQQLKGMEEQEIRNQEPGFFYQAGREKQYLSGHRFIESPILEKSQVKLTPKQCRDFNKAFGSTMKQLNYSLLDEPVIEVIHPHYARMEASLISTR